MANYKIGVEFEADGSKAVSAINQVAQAMQNLQSQTNKSAVSFSANMSKMGSSLSSFGTNLGATLGVPLALLGKSLFDATSQIEQISVALKVFTGDANIAKDLLVQFKEIAINSPLQFQDVAKGSQILMGYGVTAKQVVPIIKMLGDVSMGNTDKFNRLALAFGQVNASGRLMAQENRQMINAGFNPLLAISEKTGESMASLTKRMRDGKISVQEVADAFFYATSEGGRFSGMADEQAKTLGGLFNKLKESVFLALSEIGTKLGENTNVKEFFTTLSDSVLKLKNFFLSLSPETQSFIVKLGIMIPVLSATAVAIGSIIKGIVSLIKVVGTVIALFGGWEVLLVGGFLATIGYFIADIMSANAEMEKLNKSVAEFKNLASKNTGESGGLLLREATSKDVEFLENKVKSIKKEIAQRQGWDLQVNIDKAKANLDFYTEKLKKAKDLQQKELNFSNTGKTDDEKEAKAREKQKQKELKAKQAKENQDRIDGDYHQKQMHYIQELREAENKALEDADSAFETSLEKKLDKLTKNFEETKKLYKKYGLDYKNIQTAYLIQYAELYSAIEDKKKTILSNAMDKSIAQYRETEANQPDSWAERIKKIAQLRDQLTVTQSELKTAWATGMKDFAVNIYSGFAQIAGSMFDGITTFSDAISQVGSMFLNLFGDLLIKMGTSAIEFGITAESIQKVLTAIGLPGGGAGAIVVGSLAVATGYALKAMAQKTNQSIADSQSARMGGKQGSATKSASTVGMTTGASYQYGGASYATQTIRLAIDLTGAITASPTGYNINKSLETVLRVTGR